MTTQEAIKLFERYNNGTATLNERLLLERWYHQTQAEQKLAESDAGFILLKDEIWEGVLLRSGLKQVKQLPLVLKLRRPLIAAASVLILVSIIFYTYKIDHNKNTNLLYANDLTPGRTGATLTLANGSKINLATIRAGRIAGQPGVTVIKKINGEIIYHVDGNHGRNVALFNTLQTSNGQQTQVILPDRSIVWLNAASTLSYPTDLGLSGKHGPRVVELDGEAYFEISKDRSHPFIVKSATQEVEVLGTHFNINNYNNEESVKTTLIEGSVKVSVFKAPGQSSALSHTVVSTILKPGQESILTAGKIHVVDADTEAAVSWKNGLFMFSNENLGEIMNKISRWYDVSVVYENDNLKTEIFSGSVSKLAHVSSVLRTLEKTGSVRFEVQGKVIKVRR